MMKRWGLLISGLVLGLLIAGLPPAAVALDSDKAVAGLKEALKVGTENSVKLTGKTDGFYGNLAIRIPIPEKLKKLGQALRQVGLGKDIDEFELSLNRAAERATPAAKAIFWGALKEMTFEDALGILRGSDTAATAYFRTKTGPKLAAAFKPQVVQATSAVGATQRYKELADKARQLPLVKVEPVDIDQYVVDRTLDGLFYMLGEEEKKIRHDPVKRVTQLLKEVFG